MNRYKHGEICSVKGCYKERAYRNGYCRKHHNRVKRTGSLVLKGHIGRPLGNGKRIDTPWLQNVESLRLARDWSVMRLCREAGVSTTPFYKNRDPSLDTLRAIGAAFNVDYWRLLIPGEFYALD